MSLCILSCGIFQPELSRIFHELKCELLGHDVEVSFVAPALHVDYKKLKDGITAGLESLAPQSAGGEDEKLLLYGRMCHPDIVGMADEYSAALPLEGNCIDMFLSPERKKELESGENVFFMTAGWFKYWRDIFQQGQGWDTIDARINFGRYDKCLILDSGSFDISEEEILDFFEYVQVPIDVEPITLDYFKNIVADICRKTLHLDEQGLKSVFT